MSVSVKPLPDVISSQIVPFESIYFLALLNMQNHKAYIYYNIPLFYIVVKRNLIFAACWLDAGFIICWTFLGSASHRIHDNPDW